MDTWPENLASSINLSNDIENKIKERNNIALRGQDISHLTSSLHTSIRHYEISLAQLEDDLNIVIQDPITYRVSPNDINDRQTTLNNLQNKLNTFKKQVSISQQEAAKSARDELLGTKNNRRAWGETDNTINLANEQLLQLQKDKMKEQDKTVTKISRNVTTIKHVADDIHDELDEHHKLLDDVEHGIDINHVKVQKETFRMEKLRQEKGTCAIWVCICILLLVIIILAFV